MAGNAFNNLKAGFFSCHFDVLYASIGLGEVVQMP